MKLNLRELLVGTPTRLRYVVRFSTCHKVHPENVAEHSYYVALYCKFISDWVRFNCESEVYDAVDVEKLLTDALFHDLEEAVTGDMNRIFKYSSARLHDELHIGARDAFGTMMHKLIGEDLIFHEYLSSWDFGKEKTFYSGRILRFADFLAVLSYMVQELTNANITMREHWQTMRTYINEFSGSEYDFLRELIDDAQCLMNEAFTSAQIRSEDV